MNQTNIRRPVLRGIGGWMFLGITLFSCNSELKETNRKLQAQVDTLSSEVVTLRDENARFREYTGEELNVGFEVQIGAFEYFDITAYEDELMRFQEVQANGMSKYVLGRFRKFEDAEAFLRDVKKMGVQDAFIAGVVNGERTTVAEAKKAAVTYYSSEW